MIGAVDPDVVVLQEATRPRVVERVAAETGLRVWASRPGHSLAFMSRVEIEHHEWHRPRGARHSFLEIVPAGSALRIFGLHLSAVHANWTERRRARELRALLDGIERHQEGFHLIVGDFNALAPGELLDASRMPMRLRALVWLSRGYVRRDTIPMMIHGGYVDAFRYLHPEEKGFTFPTWDPHVRLDYLFLPESFAGRLEECRVVDGDAPVAEASDHFPLLTRLDVT